MPLTPRLHIVTLLAQLYGVLGRVQNGACEETWASRAKHKYVM